MTFDFQPALTGSLVEVRPLRVSDEADLYAVARDPLIWEQHPDQTRHTEAGFARFFRESLATGGALLVTDKTTGRAIGSSRYHGYSAERSEVEIGWTFLARSHWGGAVNGELKALMLRHAFRFVDSVIFLIGSRNFRSQRAVGKIGARLDSGPDALDRLKYRIDRSSFEEQEGKR